MALQAAVLTFAVLVSGCASRGAVPPIVFPDPGTTPAGASRAVRDLGQSLTELFTEPAAAHAVWGVQVRSLDQHETLYRLNDHTLLIPASTLKILTLAAAADQLGWDYRYETQFLATAAIEQGTLRGDLIVRGSGDPTIHAPDGRSDDDLFSRWAADLGRLGIRRIDGRLIGDDNVVDGGASEPWAGLGDGWAWNDLAFGFATPGGALQYRENVVELIVEPGNHTGAPVTARVDDPASGLQLVNRMVTAEPGSDSTFTLRRLPGQGILVLGGSIPVGAPTVHRMVSVDNPTTYFVNVLRRVLERHGISVGGDAVDVDDLPVEALASLQRQAHVLVTYHSPPLSEIAVDMMKRSQNLYAETLLRTLGTHVGGGAAASGQEVVGDLLESWNVAPDQFAIADGSGLSRYNLVTADTLVRVLERMRLDPRDPAPFEGTLPIAGRDGTLASRMAGTAAEGNARAKTGAMTSVRALAGYVQTRDGERLAFAILANNFQVPPSQIIDIVDRAVVALAAFTRR